MSKCNCILGLAVILILGQDWNSFSLGSELTPLENCTNHDSLYQHEMKSHSGSEPIIIWLGSNLSTVFIITGALGRCEPSMLQIFKSKDSGRTFSNYTNAIRNLSVITVELLNVNPVNEEKVLFTLRNCTTGNIYLLFYTSDDDILSELHTLPFQVRRSIPDKKLWMKNPFLPQMRIALGENWESSAGIKEQVQFYEAFLSVDYGKKWKPIRPMGNVSQVKWDTITGNQGFNSLCYIYLLYKSIGPHSNGTVRGFDLVRTDVNSSTFTMVAKNIMWFDVHNKFIYAAFIKSVSDDLVLKVSTSQGRVWNKIILPGNQIVQNKFKLVNALENSIFLHHNNTSGSHTLYISDSDGIVFSKSLDSHSGFSSLVSIKSLKGVFMTLVSKGNITYSVISHDGGKSWKVISCVPFDSGFTYCEALEQDADSNRINIRLENPQFSETNANNLAVIMAKGYLHVSNAKKEIVMISIDGGFTWNESLSESHLYHVLAHGSLLLANPTSPDLASMLRYSTDEGQVWKCLKITGLGVVLVSNLLTPGSSLERNQEAVPIAILSHKAQEDEYVYWNITFVDFKGIFQRSCEINDLLMKSSNESKCILGNRQSFMNLKNGSQCLLDNELLLQTNESSCICSKTDLECDFGFTTSENSNINCTLNLDLEKEVLDFCKGNEDPHHTTNGIRKQAGNNCVNFTGIVLGRPVVQKLRCTAREVVAAEINDDVMQIAIVSVIAMMIIITVLGMTVFFVHKFHQLRKETPSYRYSKLNQDDRALYLPAVESISDALVAISSSSSSDNTDDEDSPATISVQSQTLTPPSPSISLLPINVPLTGKNKMFSSINEVVTEDTDDELLAEF